MKIMAIDYGDARTGIAGFDRLPVHLRKAIGAKQLLVFGFFSATKTTHGNAPFFLYLKLSYYML